MLGVVFMHSAQEVSTIITDLLRSKGVTVKKMLEECELSPRVISNMKSDSMPSADKLAIIAQYLNVSVELLLGIAATPPIEHIEADKQRLLDMYSMLSDFDKGLILGRLEAMTSNPDNYA